MKKKLNMPTIQKIRRPYGVENIDKHILLLLME